jgi:ubiquinone/menaquinone biosynthesis C-methylase UbiE
VSIDFRPEERILEMCCGTGNSTLALATLAGAGSKLTAIDLSVGQVRRVEKNAYGRLQDRRAGTASVKPGTGPQSSG